MKMDRYETTSSDGQRVIGGIVPPMVTPLVDRDTLDVDGLERLIEHVVGGGVQGLFILGTTGEGPSLSYRLRRELIERACALVDSRVPVLVGVTDTSYEETLSLAQCAADHGACAVVAAPPYYLPPGQPELVEYYLGLADESPLPLVPYNIPACTKLNIELDTLRRLFDHPRVAAYKDSSGNMVYFNQVIQLLNGYPGKTVLIGPEEMLGEATLLGGHGGISGGANLFPRLYVELYEAARRRDIGEMRRMHGLVMQVSCSLYGVGNYGPAIIKGIKCALSCMGICDDVMAAPFHRLHERERAIIRQRVSSLTERLPMVAV